MNEFLADLHIHSRFSRATSTRLTVPHLAAWAGTKGITVLGTGDCTHPAWREELRRELAYDEASGLYRLKDPAPPALPGMPGIPETPGGVPAAADLRFMVQGEISSIYKRGGKVRKVHSLVYLPSLEAAERFSLRLEQVGNLHSDGRPILGLDCRDLLELLLETDPLAFLIPAHIWTPWFSLFGSKSGFDALEDCFGDLSDEIFALETGLSSDPAMNRLWSALDGRRLVSNSDAHSGENLGREANVFCGTVSYAGILRALKTPEQATDTRFQGTLEFFPEEGKYHRDGHRKCGVVLSPEQTRACGGLCPACGEPLTIGVLYRVLELADRSEPCYGPCYEKGETRFASLVPLPELLGEVLGVGPKSRRVGDMYAKALARFGPELSILRHTPEKELAAFFPPLAESVARMRQGRVHLAGGYDGEYGTVRMFTDEERREMLRGSRPLPQTPQTPQMPQTPQTPQMPQTPQTPPHKKNAGASTDLAAPPAQATSPAAPAAPAVKEEDEPPLRGLNPSQEAAVTAGPGPVLVLAGPGSGKTRTLVARVLRLLEEDVSARRILAVTFTRTAASEMDERLKAVLPAPLPRTDTLHALALEAWHKSAGDVPVLLSEESARRVFYEANAEEPRALAREAWEATGLAREGLLPPAPQYLPFAQRYRNLKNAWNLADYTDLLEFWLEHLESRPCSWEHVLVDEIQDLSPLQLTLLHRLCGASGKGFFGIGDPDQSIYSFRGAHGACRDFFTAAWPRISVVSLSHNYRSREGIVRLARAALEAQATGPAMIPVRTRPASIQLFQAPGAQAEAAWVAERVAGLVGLGSHTLSDAASRRRGLPARPDDAYSPGDIAVLLRTRALAAPFRAALARTGVPVSEPARDAFWADERIALILRFAGRLLGIAPAENGAEETPVPLCPDTILTKGPLALAAYLASSPPFDELFWQSAAFRSLVKAYDNTGGWAELLTWVHLRDELELVRGKGETVQIISLHAAKGLEFRAVFLPCLEDGLLPFAGPEFLAGKLVEKNGLNLDEERRLLYVGLTRAKDALYLSHAAKRSLYGRELRLKASRFLAVLPDDLLARSTLVAHHKRKEEHLTLL